MSQSREHAAAHRPAQFVLATILALLALARPAFADPPPEAQTSTDADGYTYRFHDDALQAGGLTATDPRLHVVRHATRSLLLRPRTQFIQEMLKCVENL